MSYSKYVVGGINRNNDSCFLQGKDIKAVVVLKSISSLNYCHCHIVMKTVKIIEKRSILQQTLP